jgi:hypothetical protein
MVSGLDLPVIEAARGRNGRGGRATGGAGVASSTVGIAQPTLAPLDLKLP